MNCPNGGESPRKATRTLSELADLDVGEGPTAPTHAHLRALAAANTRLARHGLPPSVGRECQFSRASGPAYRPSEIGWEDRYATTTTPVGYQYLTMPVSI